MFVYIVNEKNFFLTLGDKQMGRGDEVGCCKISKLFSAPAAREGKKLLSLIKIQSGANAILEREHFSSKMAKESLEGSSLLGKVRLKRRV